MYPTWLVEEATQRYAERLREAEAERLARAFRRQAGAGQQRAPAMLRSLLSVLRLPQQLTMRWRRTTMARRVLPEA